MEKIFISELAIEDVRHLKDVKIPLSNDKMKHLVLTGKNGSGKTSVLDALAHYFEIMMQHDTSALTASLSTGIYLEFDLPYNTIKNKVKDAEFILAYYTAERTFYAEVPKHIEKIELKNQYHITENPRALFVKYLLDLKVTEALARSSGKREKADAIKVWFIKFENLLRRIFDDDSLELVFEEETFSFYIKENRKELFDFNTMSSGFAAVLDIVLDLIIRMEKKTNRTFDFNVPGIVLVDEIETHLHIELQKTVLEMLTTIFPNVQFIVSTHSPFILNSISNTVIYDLEKRIIVKQGLINVPYSGIVEGYFKSNELSSSLEEKFKRYKELISKQELMDEDFEEIAELEMFLNEIPDYLALNITTEYQRLKLEFESREDI